MVRKAIVLTFDRLHLGYLGCYGNDWIETPGFDRFALNSIVFDQHFGESFGENTRSCAWWTGAYQFPRPSLLDARLPTLPAVLRQQGTSTRIVCESPPDDVLLAWSAGAEHSTVTGRSGPHVDESETPFAALVDDSVRWLQTAAGNRDTSWLLWINSRGVPTPWIPPRSCAARCLDRYHDRVQAAGASGAFFDSAAGATGGLPASAYRTPIQPRLDKPPVPPGDAVCSETDTRQTSEGAAADELSQLLSAGASIPVALSERAKLSARERQRLRILYAAYVTSIDRNLSRLLKAIEDFVPGDELLLVVAAAAGEPLGERTAFPESCGPPERRLVGPHERRLVRPQFWRICEENVHVPLLVQVGGVEMGSRRQELVQTVDLVPTLFEWFGVADSALPLEGHSLLPVIGGESGDTRDYLCLGDGEHAAAIRTAEFYLVRPTGGRSARTTSDDTDPALMFIKPDDIWEVNNIAAQSPDVAATLSATLNGFVQAARKSLPAEFPGRLISK